MISSYLKNTRSLPKILTSFINKTSNISDPLSNVKNENQKFSQLPEQHKHIHFLNSTLRAVIESPNSSALFDILLDEIQDLSKAESAALFLINESGNPELISITKESDYDALKEYLNHLSIDSNYNALNNTNQNSDSNFDIKIIRMSDSNMNPCGVLILKINKNLTKFLSIREIESIKFSLSGILSSVQQADMSKRMALHEERALIARELHDSLAQSLSYLKIQVSRLQSLIKPSLPKDQVDLSAVSGIAEELRTNLNISYKQLRELITTFRLTLNSKNLAQALEDSVEEFENRSSISFNLDNRLAQVDLAVDEEIQVLQIVREALSNIVRHSQASQAEITLSKSEEQTIHINIDDDGIGMNDMQTNKRRHGMIIMQQRAHDLEGKLRVQQSSLGGTQIKVSFKTKNKRGT